MSQTKKKLATPAELKAVLDDAVRAQAKLNTDHKAARERMAADARAADQKVTAAHKAYHAAKNAALLAG